MALNLSAEEAGHLRVFASAVKVTLDVNDLDQTGEFAVDGRRLRFRGLDVESYQGGGGIWHFRDLAAPDVGSGRADGSRYARQDTTLVSRENNKLRHKEYR